MTLDEYLENLGARLTFLGATPNREHLENMVRSRVAQKLGLDSSIQIHLFQTYAQVDSVFYPLDDILKVD